MMDYTEVDHVFVKAATTAYQIKKTDFQWDWPVMMDDIEVDNVSFLF